MIHADFNFPSLMRQQLNECKWILNFFSVIIGSVKESWNENQQTHTHSVAGPNKIFRTKYLSVCLNIQTIVSE